MSPVSAASRLRYVRYADGNANGVRSTDIALGIDTPLGAGGTHIVRVAGHVLRCGVASLSATDGVVYVGALRFDGPCDLPWAESSRRG